MSAKRRRGTSEGKKSKFVLKEKCDTFQKRFARMSFKKEQRGSGGARKRIIMFFCLNNETVVVRCELFYDYAENITAR